MIFPDPSSNSSLPQPFSVSLLPVFLLWILVNHVILKVNYVILKAQFFKASLLTLWAWINFTIFSFAHHLLLSNQKCGLSLNQLLFSTTTWVSHEKCFFVIDLWVHFSLKSLFTLILPSLIWVYWKLSSRYF